MIPLEKITTEYIPEEDRIRLAGQRGQSVTVVWLTLRMTNKVVPALCAWLEQQTAHVPSGQVVQEFKQQAAKASLKHQSPVKVAQKSDIVLPIAVDINKSNEYITLNFKGKNDASAKIVFSAVQLRQWLQILHQNVCRAGWVSKVWPEWIVSNEKPSPGKSFVH